MSDRKLHIVRSILSNPVYETTSGIYQRLEARLANLSEQDLADLDVLIDQKIQAAIRRTEEYARTVTLD